MGVSTGRGLEGDYEHFVEVVELMKMVEVVEKIEVVNMVEAVGLGGGLEAGQLETVLVAVTLIVIKVVAALVIAAIKVTVDESSASVLVTYFLLIISPSDLVTVEVCATIEGVLLPVELVAGVLVSVFIIPFGARTRGLYCITRGD